MRPINCHPAPGGGTWGYRKKVAGIAAQEYLGLAFGGTDGLLIL